MSENEKADLRAKGEGLLAHFERRMDEDLQTGDIERAWSGHSHFFGAISMLHSLGLIPSSEYDARLKTSFERYLKGAYPPVSPKEAEA
ncbi:MAG: hypothetical protein NC489_28050 [Ruminococcus flavefaciens]|nr:hypothetical protein [Ruminococcus flavefaciens]